MKKSYTINMVIDDRKENVKVTSKVNLLFKIKFILYVLLSIYGLCFAILTTFDELQIADKFSITNKRNNNNNINNYNNNVGDFK